MATPFPLPRGWGSASLTSEMFDTALRSIIATLGQTVEYIHAGAEDAVQIRAVFERKSLAVDTGVGVETSLNVPTLLLSLDSLPAAPAARDRVRVNEMEYSVSNVQQDGHGGAELILRARS